MSVYDDFSLPSLSTDKWTTVLQNGSVSISEGQLLCSFSDSAPCLAAAQAKTKTNSTTGATAISCKWTPGTHYASGYGCPYLALVPAGTISRDGNYKFPLTVPMLRLGQQSDGDNRTLLTVGVSGDTQAINGTNNTASGTWTNGTQYTLEWIINWTANTMTLKVDGSTVIASAGFTYTTAADLFLEAANSGYGGGARDERFDDILFSGAVFYYVSGIITDSNGDPCQRKVYAVSRPIDSTEPQIRAHGLSDPATGVYELVLSSADEITRVVVSEDDDDPFLNDIVDRVIPA